MNVNCEHITHELFCKYNLYSKIPHKELSEIIDRVTKQATAWTLSNHGFDSSIDAFVNEGINPELVVKKRSRSLGTQADHIQAEIARDTVETKWSNSLLRQKITQFVKTTALSFLLGRERSEPSRYIVGNTTYYWKQQIRLSYRSHLYTKEQIEIAGYLGAKVSKTIDTIARRTPTFLQEYILQKLKLEQNYPKYSITTPKSLIQDMIDYAEQIDRINFDCLKLNALDYHYNPRPPIYFYNEKVIALTEKRWEGTMRKKNFPSDETYIAIHEYLEKVKKALKEMDGIAFDGRELFKKLDLKHPFEDRLYPHLETHQILESMSSHQELRTRLISTFLVELANQDRRNYFKKDKFYTFNDDQFIETKELWMKKMTSYEEVKKLPRKPTFKNICKQLNKISSTTYQALQKMDNRFFNGRSLFPEEIREFLDEERILSENETLELVSTFKPGYIDRMKSCKEEEYLTNYRMYYTLHFIDFILSKSAVGN